MDGLSIITGIAITVFLLFYLAFNIEKNHIALKILLIIGGLTMLMFIPTTTIKLQEDCGILNNGTYTCFNSTGGQITPTDSKVGENFTSAYTLLFIIFLTYMFLYYLVYFILKRLGKVGQESAKGSKSAGYGKEKYDS